MQQRTSTLDDYHKRINIVIEYIDTHLNEEMKLEMLAAISNFSPYHFHRIIKAFLGEPIGDYIARKRLETAVRLLRYTDMPIKHVAYHVGYDTPSSLTKKFKQYFGITPLNCRNVREFSIVKPFEVKPDLDIQQVRMERRQATNVLYVRLVGDYFHHNYYDIWMQLFDYASQSGCDLSNSEQLAVYHDSPKLTMPENQMSDMCLVLHHDVTPEGKYGVKYLAGGLYMVYSYCGPATDLEHVYDTIYGKLIPESGLQLDERPMFHKYMNDPHTTPQEKWVREIFIPVKDLGDKKSDSFSCEVAESM